MKSSRRMDTVLDFDESSSRIQNIFSFSSQYHLASLCSKMAACFKVTKINQL